MLLVMAIPLGFPPCVCVTEIWVDSLPSQLWVEQDSPSSELQLS
ncbi:expressed unknown protein [Ectocarpus siliculosus]|uniref:Uncharacterized protein n=1 Tax=Ectocarpus siliculosus TaxID=2880 RepID=D8LM98_ECTSI|nr:expressed unknown protein [Ectocarpus siliculosus]|eukprot:CBN77508.1 expressed unknown protein [Ectocarpus siliculosus]